MYDSDKDLTPIEALRKGLCPMCIGRGIVYNIAHYRTEPCDACGGSGKLEDMERYLVRDLN